MGVFKVKKGLDLPIVGAPNQEISKTKEKITSVGLICTDFPFLKPILEVKEGDTVKVGSPLFLDNKSGHKFTSIAGGVVKKINRGEKRKLLSIEVDLDVNEMYEEFKSFSHAEIMNLSGEEIRDQLIISGLWNRLRTRPFSKIPNPLNKPRSIFVTAIDTSPLAPDPKLIIQENAKAFSMGLDVIARMYNIEVNVCSSANELNANISPEGFTIPHGRSPNIFFHFFSGPHPAGLVGTHIHHIDPITHIKDEVWHLGYQDVVAIGKLFETGKLFLDRYVALSGPQVKNPRILKIREGANLFQVIKNETLEGAGIENRVISGSILAGQSANQEGLGFLSHFVNTVTVLPEDRRRFFHGFVAPGFDNFSVKPIVASKLLGKDKKFTFGTLLNGSVRDIVPIGSYEKVMPLDIEITYLVRALLMGDLETAEKLGALELDEEDLSLVTFACPGKNDIGLALANVLKNIEKENT